MNHKMVSYILGRILFITGVLMVPSLVVALIYREGLAGLMAFPSEHRGLLVPSAC